MKVLLIEPGYKNKYPPMALMKLSTYHKMRGDDVTFFKGSPKELIKEAVESIAIQKYKELYPNKGNHLIPVRLIKNILKKPTLDDEIELSLLCGNEDYVNHLKTLRSNKFKKELIQQDSWKWDRIYVTTLFTFYWEITIKTIREAKLLLRNGGQIYTGGVAATMLTDTLVKEADIPRSSVLTGLLNQPGQLDKGDKSIIDELPLDYSILDEIEYEYAEQGNFYAYTTRGCVNHCPFCVVPLLEPKYHNYISLRSRLNYTREQYGDQKNLLLLDNNVMASASYKEIIEEIRDCGFAKGSYFIKPNYLTTIMQHISAGANDKGRRIKAVKLMVHYLEGLSSLHERRQEFYSLMLKNQFFCDLKLLLPSREQIVEVYETIKEQYNKSIPKSKSLRYVDFNQGVDARLITDEKMELMSQIAIKPLRIAFDSWGLRDVYEKAVRCAARHGLKYLSNYLLYNFKDKPEELYYRMRKNVELGQELDLQIFSFPMKYHPVKEEPFFRNRDYIGKYWNRKYIRSIQCILNATKGKVGPKLDFFNEAFGKDINEFKKLLIMPEEFIVMRSLNKKNGRTDEWWQKYSALTDQEKKQALAVIHRNRYNPDDWADFSLAVREVLKFYSTQPDKWAKQ